MPAPGKLISIVTPCFNEGENVLAHFEQVTAAIAPFRDRYAFEHIYTDNCSQDDTFAKLSDLARAHPNVRVVRFSRNIGANRATYQGLIRARGDAAILIQGDLQDPPELIPAFIAGWEEGFDVVFGQITNREENLFTRNLRRLYYRIVALLADVQTPENAGDFRLTSRRVLDALRHYSEDDIYLRGVVAHIGYRQKAVPYARRARLKGRTSTNFLYLLGYAINGLVSTTVVPLRLATICGSLIALTSFCIGLYSLIYRLLYPEFVPQGFATVAIMIAFLTGIQLLFLGIIGEYIRKIYNQILNRPSAHVQDEINF